MNRLQLYKKIRKQILAFSLCSFLTLPYPVVAANNSSAEENAYMSQKIGEIEIKDATSLEWIKDYHLETLQVFISTDDVKSLEIITEIPTLKNLILVSRENLTLNEETYAFLKECKQLESLTVVGFHVMPGFIESLTFLKNLSIDVSLWAFQTNNVHLNYKKLAFLEKLEFRFGEPCDIAIFFSKEDYEFLEANGVNIIIPESNIELLKKVNDELYQMANQIDIPKDATEEEKVEAIGNYILSHYSYDSEVSLYEQEEIKDHYYLNGYLFAALNRDEIICGNFASFFSAMCYRKGVNSYFLRNETHAWNAVEENGHYYVVDTSLDVKEGLYLFDKTKLIWLTNVENPKLYQMIWNLPDDVSLENKQIEIKTINPNTLGIVFLSFGVGFKGLGKIKMKRLDER